MLSSKLTIKISLVNYNSFKHVIFNRKQIAENDVKQRRVENDILNLTTNSLPTILQHAQEAQETRILRGDYDLKIMRQNYFLDRQDQVIVLCQYLFLEFDLLVTYFVTT